MSCSLKKKAEKPEQKADQFSIPLLKKQKISL